MFHSKSPMFLTKITGVDGFCNKGELTNCFRCSIQAYGIYNFSSKSDEGEGIGNTANVFSPVVLLINSGDLQGLYMSVMNGVCHDEIVCYTLQNVEGKSKIMTTVKFDNCIGIYIDIITGQVANHCHKSIYNLSSLVQKSVQEKLDLRRSIEMMTRLNYHDFMSTLQESPLAVQGSTEYYALYIFNYFKVEFEYEEYKHNVKKGLMKSTFVVTD